MENLHQHKTIFCVKSHVPFPVHVHSKEGPEDLAVLHQQVAEPGTGLDGWEQ